jgi:hypothetical protein
MVLIYKVYKAQLVLLVSLARKALQVHKVRRALRVQQGSLDRPVLVAQLGQRGCLVILELVGPLDFQVELETRDPQVLLVV